MKTENTKESRAFPNNFLWGAATSSHQVEGGTTNDWSEWERANADRLAREAASKFGHLPGWTEKFGAEAARPENYISGLAVDHYHRYEEDFDIAKSLNHTAHRFSIEWSRVEPEEGTWDEKEIEHYRDVVRALRARNIEPFVTLWHWTLPLWLTQEGGVLAPRFPEYFARYAEKIAQSLGDITFWISVNEPNIYTVFSYIKGTQPPGKRSVLGGLRAFHKILKCHKKAYEIIHRYNKNAQVGIANSTFYFEPKNNFFANKVLAHIYTSLWNLYSFTHTNKQIDFIGLNYYSRNMVGFGSNKKQHENTRGDLGWEIFPEGIYFVLKNLSRYSLPMYITENGLPDTDDSRREKFIKDHLFFVHKAIEDGADVRGYLHWSLLDNSEFVELRGFWPRFGLVEVDRATQKRTIRQSARYYAEICHNNALEVPD